jgi:hypothetical protein
MSRRPRDPGSETGGTEDGFVQRWSRRKAEAGQAETSTRQEPSPPPAEPAKVMTDADMPPIDSLNENSDFSLFLSPGVSEELRKLALRKLFHLPQFSERCPLDGEYYDCTNLEPLGSIITYDMREEMKRAAEKLAETLNEPPPGDTPAAIATAPEPVAAPSDSPRDSGTVTAAAPTKTRKPTARRRTRSRRKA